MRRVFLALACLVLSVSAAAASSLKYELDVGGPAAAVNADGLDPYNFINHFFGDILSPLGLMDKLTVPEKAEIIKTLFSNLSDAHAASVRIKKYDGRDDLFIGYRIQKNQDGDRVLAVITNYDPERRALITDGDLSTAYAGQMYLRGERLVPEYYLYTKEKEEQIEDNLNNLADFYLFDDEPANDGKIEGLLHTCIDDSAKDPVGKFIGLMTLSQYRISTRKFDQAAASLQQAHEVWQDGIVKDKDALLAVYTSTYEECAVYSKYWQNR